MLLEPNFSKAGLLQAIVTTISLNPLPRTVLLAGQTSQLYGLL